MVWTTIARIHPEWRSLVSSIMHIDERSAAIVTGGGSGLGAATVRSLHDAGAVVVIADLPSSGGADLAAGLERTRFVATDVRDTAAVDSAVAVARELGRLRVAVSCAGVATPGRILGRHGALPVEDFAEVVGVNLTGTYALVRAAAVAMAAEEAVDGERGVIVMTASVAAYDGQVGQAAYAASKAGVVGMTLSAARDLAQHLIRVVTIAPGTFATPLLAALPEETRAALEAQTPHPARLGRPQEYAALVMHVVANPMVNGETIRLDGALRMPAR